MPENPRLLDSNGEKVWSDITLRDLLAGMAMQGFAGQRETLQALVLQNPDVSVWEFIAEPAYLVADAMLAAREK